MTRTVIALVGMLTCWIPVVTAAADSGTITEAGGATSARSIHPSFPLLDSAGIHVLESHGPASPVTTCGACHDTDFIASHNPHSVASVPDAADFLWEPLPGSIATRHRLGLVSAPAGVDCFVCHVQDPNVAARLQTLGDGNLEWVPTATLAGRDLVESASDDPRWQWNSDAFDEAGHVLPDRLTVVDPGSANCGACHGAVHDPADGPLLLTEIGPGSATFLTGEVFSSERISQSGLNLQDKETMARAWDAHAERALDCVACHHSITNPAYHDGPDAGRPEHLKIEARRMEIGDYLLRPEHTLTRASDTSLRSCAPCHNVESTHDWIPYTARHLDALACSACHMPDLHAPAAQVLDWTLLDLQGNPRLETRGISDQLIDGYQPILLPRREGDGVVRLTPHNLVTAWFWEDAATGEPVLPDVVREALSTDGRYRHELVKVLDEDGDGQLSGAERVLNDGESIATARGLLMAAGVADPSVAGQVRSYPIRHGVVPGSGATRDCEDCHSGESRLNAPFRLANVAPFGVVPAFRNDHRVVFDGEVETDESGAVTVRPVTSEAGFYVLGHDHVRAANLLGLLTVVLVLVGIVVHSALRIVAARRSPASPVALGEPVYMYTVYERFWHWLQAFAILVLLVTGLKIHFPEWMPLPGFAISVRIHNVVGFIVVANALFAAVYHFASGEIRQYVPEPRGFFRQALLQSRYYVSGMFRNQPHPFEKTPQKKLNPLQQMTYVAILNVLLPLQVVTGILIWGVQRWPAVDAAMGGLTVLAPLHALGAWDFAAFLLMHIYLTTTGRTVGTNLRAMVVGWEESLPREPGKGAQS